MVRLLTKYPFSEADITLPDVQAFDCGDAPWDIEVAEWIESRSGNNSVLEDMKKFGTEGWLYRDEDGVLVGYSSLGQTKFTWPVGTKKKETVSIIPFIGVRRVFQGEPRDATTRDDKYAYQILADLLSYAAGIGNRFPVAILSVDERNIRAIRFYLNRGFVDLKIPRVSAGVAYLRMAVPLDQRGHA